MERGQRQAQPDELFFQKPSTPAPETPTVGPLRINKATPPSRHSSTGAVLDGDEYNDPPRFTSPPYPDDRPKPLSPRPLQSPQGADRTRRISTPDDGRKTTPTGRARFAATDPYRPTVSGYSHSPPPALKPAGGRGGTPNSLPESPGPETPEKDEDLFQRAPSRPAVPAKSPEAPLTQSTYQQYYPPPTDAQAAPSAQQASAGVNRFASTSTTRAERGSPPPPETPVAGRPALPDARYQVPATAAGLQAQGAAAAQRLSPYNVQATRPGAGSSPQPTQPQQEAQRPWTPTEQPGSNPYGPPAVYQGMNEVPAPTAAYQPPAQPAQYQPPVQQTQYQPPVQQTQTQYQPPTQQTQYQAPAQGAFPSPSQPVQHQPPAQPTQSQPASSRFSFMPQSTALEQDMGRLSVGEEPPPAYSSVNHPAQNGPTTSQGYPYEKRSSIGNPADLPAAAAAAAAAPASHQDPNLARHPAFAHDTPAQPISPSHPAAAGLAPIAVGAASTPSPGVTAGPSSPPPLPEGWIAHLDPNSGQYYYIHLPTQSTQWEFPKGPLPLKMNEPLSPTGTYVAPLASPAYGGFAAQPMASPGFPPQTPFTPMSTMGALASPTVAGFTGPPPSAGVDLYKVQPTNGVYFGPYLRYTNMDLERGLWLGSILLVTDVPQPPTIHIHQSIDLSPNPRQLKANQIYTHQRWVFYRYDIDLHMEEQSTRWTYAITSHLGCTRYEFLVAGRYEPSWRFIAHSGNDFALNVNAAERSKLGGVGLMWKDVLQKHVECGGFHAQLGLGGQIYGDRLWKEIPALKQWTAISGKENRKNAPWTATHEADVLHAYFHYYTSHFDQPHVREAFAQIPHVLTLDDNDIFDGYGSYPDYMQQSHMFSNIGRIGIDMYLLFQHHTTHEILRNVNDDLDLFTITGKGWHFVKYLGPAVVVVGPDTRSERDAHHVMAGPTYQGLFPKVAILPPSVQHCIWLIPVPLLYPRLETAETIAHTMATGKKAVTGTFNMLGRVTSSVAGVVGAKGVVNDGFSSVKRAVGKSGLMSSVLSPFGEVDMLDELRDMWTHESKDLERTYIIRTLQGIAHNKSVRMTFLSGSVDACGAGLVHDPAHPSDHKTMYQLISSSIVNAPPPSYVLRLLNQNPKQPIYIPANGHRSSSLVGSHGEVRATDTKEDMMEIFVADVNGAPRDGQRKLMGRRNYVALVAYDPDLVQTQFGTVTTPGSGGSGGSNGGGNNNKPGGRLSLAADFMVQNEGAYSQPVKYGPVIIPSLDFGR